jgi:M6 family metalloprotease-like protein
MARIRGLRGAKSIHLFRLLILNLILSLAPISFIQEVSAAPISVTECKLRDPFQSVVRLGFPKNPSRLNAAGNQNILLMAVDYSDAPANVDAVEELKLAFDTAQTNTFFKSVSYDKVSLSFEYFPRVVRLPRPSSNYIGQITNVYPPNIKVYDIMQDATAAIANQINFSNFQAVAILDVASIDSWGFWGFALPYESPGYYTSSGYIKNSTVISGFTGSKTNKPSQGYRTSTLIHELGHLFGFIDLYIIKPGNYFIGQTPGPFDVMNAKGEFLGWQRWLQGWITDSNISCFSFNDPATTLQLRPLGKANTGTQLAVIKVSDQKALVLESRKGTVTDELGVNEGLLAYEIDLSIQSLQGPVKIIPKNSPTTLSAISPDLSDFDRFLDATAQTGEYIRYKDILIENKLGNSAGENIQMFKGEDAAQRQRELDSIKRTAMLAEYNQVRIAKQNKEYFESPTCIYRNQKMTFQILDENRAWKDLNVPISHTSDATCFSAMQTKPYIIAKLPSRTFYRGKVTIPGTNNEWYTSVVISDVIPLNDKTQVELEIALAKLEDNYLVDISGCHSRGVTGTFQIEKNGQFVDFAEVISWLPATDCGAPQNAVRPTQVARLTSGTKYRFKLQNAGWDRDYFTQTYTKGKTTPELLAETNKAIVSVKAELTALINSLGSEKKQLEGTVSTLSSQLLTSISEVDRLQVTILEQKGNIESISGELVTTKTKLEGDVINLQKENEALKLKIAEKSKTTIICVKGALQKRITAVKPICPAGYKKKT